MWWMPSDPGVLALCQLQAPSRASPYSLRGCQMLTITAAGYVGQAHLKDLPSGDVVLNFSLAISTGTKENPQTTWIGCSLWGKRATLLADYIKKGTYLTIQGDGSHRAWLGKESGEAKSELTCRVDRLTFGPRSGSPEAPHETPAPPTAQTPKPEQVAPALDEDIPF